MNSAEIDEMIEKIAEMKTKFLERNGWKCNYEFGLCMWQKEVNGKTLVTYEELAVHIEKEIQST